MPLAHIRSGAEIQRYRDEKGWLALEDGRRVSPIVEGFEDGNDKVVPIVEQTNDTSTGPDTVSTATTTVEADRVLVQTDIRDMTEQEITDRDEAQKDAQAGNVRDVLIKVITNHENRIRTLESRPSVTEEQVRTFLRSLL